jgi:hypothetical protein
MDASGVMAGTGVVVAPTSVLTRHTAQEML